MCMFAVGQHPSADVGHISTAMRAYVRACVRACVCACVCGWVRACVWVRVGACKCIVYVRMHAYRRPSQYS